MDWVLSRAGVVWRVTMRLILVAGFVAGAWPGWGQVALVSSNVVAINGGVQAITTHTNGVTYVGGSFTRAGLFQGKFIAASTNGVVQTNWVRGESTFEGVFDIEPDGAGGWYVGGSMTVVENQNFFRLVHVLPDGRLNTNFNPAPSGAVRSMELVGDTLYFAGDFGNVGGVTRNRAAAVTTNGVLLSWNPNVNNSVRSLDVAGPVVYLGGQFATVGGQSRANLAAVGTNGVVLPWNPGASTTVRTVAAASNVVYVGGEFVTAGGAPRNRIAAIDTNGVATAWNPNASGNVNVIVPFGTNVLVGGEFTTIVGTTRNRMALISEGGILQGFNPNANGNVNDVRPRGNVIWVGGDFTTIGGQSRTRVAGLGLDGLALSFNPGAEGAAVRTVDAQGDIVFFGGDFEFTTVLSVARNRIMALGPSGQLLPFAPNIPGGEVRSIVTDGTNLYVAGSFTTVNSVTRNRLARLDTNGTLLSWNPNASATVRAMVKLGTNLYFGGEFATVSAVGRNRLAGMSEEGVLLPWNPNADNTVDTLMESGGVLYAGGSFLNVSATARSRMAALTPDGTLLGWNPNANNTVRGFFADSGLIYCFGTFTQLGVDTRNRIAAVDTNGVVQVFNPGASGAGNLVITALRRGSDLIVSGDYSTIGGVNNRGPVIMTTGGAVNNTFRPDATGPANAIALSGDGTLLYCGLSFNSVVKRRTFAAIRTVFGPTGLTLSSTNVAENQAVGTVVGNLVATDPDSGSHTFRLVSGAGSTDNASFSIVGTELRTAASFDFETKSSYSVRVRATDADFQLFERALTVVVTNVNEAPVISNGAGPLAVTMSEDGAPTAFVAPSLAAVDPDTGATLGWSVSVASTNGVATVSGTGASPSTHQYVPATNVNGLDSYEVRVSDGALSDTIRIDVTLREANDPPTAGDDSLSAVAEDSGTRTIPVATLLANDAAGPANESGQGLSVSAVASGMGGTASLVGTNVQVALLPNYTGLVEFAYTVMDNGLTDGANDPRTDQGTASFSVTPVPDAPVIAEGGTSQVTMSEDGFPTAFALELNASDADGDALGWSIVGAATNGVASVEATGTNVTVSYTPAADYVGSDSFEVAVSDGGLSATNRVSVTIEPVNDAPVLDAPMELVFLEDSGTNFGVMARDLEGPVEVTGVSNALVSAVQVTPSGLVTNEARVVSIVGATNAYGSNALSLVVSDGVLGSTATVAVVVIGVNDAPTVTLVSTGLVWTTEDGAFSSNWVSEFVAGPNEVEDVAAYEVVVGASNLFDAVPAIATNGVLTFVPASGAEGSTEVTVRARDAGGSLNGGVDTSEPVTFELTLVRAPGGTTGTTGGTTSGTGETGGTTGGTTGSGSDSGGASTGGTAGGTSSGGVTGGTGTGDTGMGTGSGGSSTAGGTGGATGLDWIVEVRRPRAGKTVKFRPGTQGLGNVKGRLTGVTLAAKTAGVQVEVALNLAGTTLVATWRPADRVGKVNKSGVVKFKARKFASELAADALVSGQSVEVWVRATEPGASFETLSTTTNQTPIQIK